jgi:hypothetical protein
MDRLKILTILLLISACRTHYQPPEGADTVTLHIHNDSGSRMSAFQFENPEDCSGQEKIISVSGILPLEEVQLKIVADKPFSILFTWFLFAGYNSQSANMPVTFLPKAGLEYDFTFRVSGDRYAGYLTYRASNGPAPDPTFRIREFRTPLLPGGSFCK